MLKKKYNYLLILLIILAVNDLKAQNEVDGILSDANVVLKRLSPLPSQVAGVKDPVISLNGTWEVALEEGKTSEVQVPGELIMQGFDLNTGETAHYRKRIDIPGDWSGKRIFIRFDGVSSYAQVKLNGKTVVEHEGSFVPFEAEISERITAGRNVLEVDVRANTISDILGCTSQYAAHTVAGILRKVTLFVLPETNISDLSVYTEFDDSFRDADLRVNVTTETPNTDTQKKQIRLSLFGGDKKVLQKTYPVSSDQMKLSVRVKKPKQWNPESPFLYDLSVELIENNKVLQKNKLKIGIRQVEVRGSRVYVNGTPIKLHGVNRHQAHPLTGRSLDPETERLNAELYKKANCNYIRTSHYPPSEEFLNAADEIGLFVESEASLTWIEHHASPIWGKWNYLDEKFLPYMLRANIENVQATKNHPSIIIWSMANESRWSPLWDKVKKVVKNLDPTRPVSFHDQCWGGFNNAGSTADIANYHYPGINGPTATDTVSRPVLFGEYAHLPTYNRRELATDPGVRDAYNQPLVTFYDSIYAHPNNLGGAIWSGIDDTFHLPNGKIVGYGPWGPLDGWRRPKPEYFGMKKAYSPVKVKSVEQEKGKLLVKVQNRYDFTSLSKIRITAELNGKRIDLKSDIAPGKTGMIKIPFRGSLNDLKLSFYNSRGNIVEEEYFNYREKKDPELKEVKPLSFSENDDSYRIQQGEITYRISKIKGNVVSVNKKGKPIILQGPEFTVVPMNRETGGKNDIAGETYQRVINPIQNFSWYIKYVSDLKLEKKTDSIVVSMKVTYKEGDGKLWYIFSSDGKFVTRYEIDKIKHEGSPYQYGLLMQLPKSFDELSWKRKGDFTIYPKDHIGRNTGTAKLNSRITTGVEPWREVPDHAWKDDANELGSNDFRSTKRNIISSSLTDTASGIKVMVLSNAQQASRTWLQEEQINWLIADYSNNGSEPFYGSPHSNGRIKLNKESVLKGELTLIIE